VIRVRNDRAVLAGAPAKVFQSPPRALGVTLLASALGHNCEDNTSEVGRHPRLTESEGILGM
jgi:hypothetical protein